MSTEQANRNWNEGPTTTLSPSERIGQRMLISIDGPTSLNPTEIAIERRDDIPAIAVWAQQWGAQETQIARWDSQTNEWGPNLSYWKVEDRQFSDYNLETCAEEAYAILRDVNGPDFW